MAFWKKKAKKSVDVVRPKVEKPEIKSKKTRKVLPVEVRVLGAKARDLGLGAAIFVYRSFARKKFPICPANFDFFCDGRSF